LLVFASYRGDVLLRACGAAEYSLRPHGSALWQLDTARRALTLVALLPGDGDTAFPSVVQLAPHRFLIWNYSRCV
jgi:hypothetical protein